MVIKFKGMVLEVMAMVEVVVVETISVEVAISSSPAESPVLLEAETRGGGWLNAGAAYAVGIKYRKRSLNEVDDDASSSDAGGVGGGVVDIEVEASSSAGADAGVDDGVDGGVDDAIVLEEELGPAMSSVKEEVGIVPVAAGGVSDAGRERLVVDDAVSEAAVSSVVELGVTSSISVDEELSVEVDWVVLAENSEGATNEDPPPEGAVELDGIVTDGLGVVEAVLKNQLNRKVALWNIFPPESAPEKFPQKIWLVLVVNIAELASVNALPGAPNGTSGLPRAFCTFCQLPIHSEG